MSGEVNVFMDPYLNIYTKADQIAVADGLVELFNEDIVLREQQKNPEGSGRLVESKLSQFKEKESNKPRKANYSLQDIVESKLNNVIERERQQERKDTETEKQAEKEVIKNKNEKSADQSKEAEISCSTMLQKEKCLEDQNKVEDLCAVNTVAHTDQKHGKAVNTEQQREPIRNVSLHTTKKCNEIDNKEAIFILQPESSIKDNKTKGPECLRMDSSEEQHDDIMKKVKLTETAIEGNPIDVKQPKNKVKGMDSEKVMNRHMKELSTGGVCLNATKSQDATNNEDQCKVKDNTCLQSDNTEEKKNIIKKADEQEYEHLYEVPDVLLTSSVGYINEPDEHMREQFKQLNNVTLHIAVTGSTGAGKSTFINAIRGLQPDDKNAASTGVIETTMVSTMYEHPTMPNVKFWDLPGTGSPKFKAKKYLKEVKLETYDFFIIISSERFKENDILLAKAIKEKKKIFYFLRSKIDNDIQAESQRKDFDEQKVLSQIRDDCQRNLREMGNPNVFLISSFDLNKYDFQALTDTLTEQLPAHKRDALILSLPIYSSKIVEEKISTFMKQACSAAIASGSIAVAPVPGLSTACDAAILLGFFTKCYYAFGLDDDSIDKLSVRANNPSLKSVRNSPLVVAIKQKRLTNTELAALTSKKAAVKFAWSMVLGIGSKKAAEMSYNSTLDLLQTGLQELADTAREVLKAAGLTDVY